MMRRNSSSLTSPSPSRSASSIISCATTSKLSADISAHSLCRAWCCQSGGQLTSAPALCKSCVVLA